ncbi:sugar ABC transporter permease [Humitalea sp. 24SJ18S-53]|uniref:sugar ABC transporter permease n=1 Tax=Humitalea sp. 24SJ18S-53 TaxID=3422307 RepID=UPI003D66D653
MPWRRRRRRPTRLPGMKAGLLRTLGIDPRLAALVATLAAIWLGLHALTDGAFLTPRNLWNLAAQTAVVGIMACGMVLVIVTRRIDLSVGSIAGCVGMVIAVLQVEIFAPGTWWNPWLTLAIGLAVGAGIGAAQGALNAYLGIPAFVVTLAGLLIFRGIAWLITSGRTVAPMDPTFQLLGGGFEGSIGGSASWLVGAAGVAVLAWLRLSTRRRQQSFGFVTRPLWAEAVTILVMAVFILGFVAVMNSYTRPRTDIVQGISIPVLVLIAVACALEWLARTRRFGRYVYAIGGNPEAARLAGVPSARIIVAVFALMGFLAGLAGAVATARLNAGANSTGELAELSVIAAAVIGGTSLAGGSGTVVGAVLGALIMQSLDNGMVLLGLPSALRNVIIGVVLIVAVWADALWRKRSGKAAEA